MPEGVRVSDVVSVGGYADTPAVNYWEGASAAPVGSAAMTRIMVLQSLRQPTANEHIWTNWQNNPKGWAWLGSATGFTFRVVDGTPASIEASPVVGLRRFGRLFICAGSYDGVNVRAQVNALTASGAAGGGITVGTAALVVGSRAVFYTLPTTSYSVAMMMSTDLVALSAANIATAVTQITQDMENGRDPSTRVEALLGGAPADYTYWNAEDAIDGAGVVKPTWVPRIGANTLTRTGNLSAFSTQARLV